MKALFTKCILMIWFINTLMANECIAQIVNVSYTRNTKQYELTNHLGNVLATISDSKKVVSNEVTILTTSDYYAFGMEIKERSYSLDEVFRYGYNGKENDRDWGTGLIQDYGFRLYNPAVARFLSVDPLSPEYPWYTPYQFAGNKPIQFIDLDGLEEKEPVSNTGFSQEKVEIKDPMIGNYNYNLYNLTLTTESLFSIVDNDKLKEFTKKYKVYSSIQLRKFESLKRLSNLTGVIGLKIGQFDFGFGNDFLLHKFHAGWNAEYNVFTPTDGGLTQHLNITQWNKSGTFGIGLSSYGFTPHRTVFGDPNEYITPNKGGKGVLYHYGLFNTPKFEGDNRNFIYLRLYFMQRLRNISIQIGFQDQTTRVKAQGYIHAKQEIGEHRSGEEVPDYIFLNIQITPKAKLKPKFQNFHEVAF